MKTKNRIYQALFILFFTTLACSLPSNQASRSTSETSAALTVTAISQSDQTQTSAEDTNSTPTDINNPTETATSTSTPTPTATSTFTPIPSATFTSSPTPIIPIVVFPVFTNTSEPIVVFPVFPIGSGSVSGFVFFDLNLNGVFNPEIGETPAQSGNARVMKGACPGGEIVTQLSTAANGTFTKTDLPVGTYCILVVPNAIAWGGSYGPTAPNPAQRTVQITNGNNSSAGIFGFHIQ